MTPPQSPVRIVAAASVKRMSRARYSSPAAAALSVLSIPPMIVTSANGSATARQGSARHRAPGPVAAEREPDLHEADRDGRGHAHLPREHRIRSRHHHGPEDA